MQWQPHITVATVIEDQGRFLLVEEMAEGRAVFNQPAGHLEANESLLQAALRETLEETGWDVELTGVTGIYLYTAPSNGITYQRVCFAAKPLQQRPNYPHARSNYSARNRRYVRRRRLLGFGPAPA